VRTVAAPGSFASWFKAQLDARPWGLRETARALGVSHPTLSEVLAGRQPSFETCVRAARAFGLAPVTVLVKAGLLPENPDEATFDDLKFVLSQLSARDRQELLEFARLKLRMQEAEAQAQRQARPRASEGGGRGARGGLAPQPAR